MDDTARELRREMVVQTAKAMFVNLCQPVMDTDENGNKMQGIFFPNPDGCFQAAEVWVDAQMHYFETGEYFKREVAEAPHAEETE
jgi:hypothetical protein